MFALKYTKIFYWADIAFGSDSLKYPVMQKEEKRPGWN